MSKHYSKVELLATKKSTRILDEDHFVSQAPILQTYKIPSVIDGAASPFSLKPILDKIKFQAIVTELYNFLTIIDFLT